MFIEIETGNLIVQLLNGYQTNPLIYFSIFLLNTFYVLSTIMVFIYKTFE